MEWRGWDCDGYLVGGLKAFVVENPTDPRVGQNRERGTPLASGKPHGDAGSTMDIMDGCSWYLKCTLAHRDAIVPGKGK